MWELKLNQQNKMTPPAHVMLITMQGMWIGETKGFGLENRGSRV